ncbi:MAG: helix-turn-helix domain-containing protein [Pseudomonadota bacterium]
MELENAKKRLGLRLKEIRTARGMRQEDMEKHGFSYRYYGRMERGLVNPTIETLLRLCDIFDITLPDLFAFVSDGTVSEDAEAVAMKVAEVFKQGDPKKIAKLKVFLEEIL